MVSERFFFVTCNERRNRTHLEERDFECLASVIHARQRGHGFLLTARVFLPDHWRAIIFPQYPLTISRLMETIKVSSASLLNPGREEGEQIGQPRFFDRALRTVKEYDESAESIDWNPVH